MCTLAVLSVLEHEASASKAFLVELQWILPPLVVFPPVNSSLRGRLYRHRGNRRAASFTGAGGFYLDGVDVVEDAPPVTCCSYIFGGVTGHKVWSREWLSLLITDQFYGIDRGEGGAMTHQSPEREGVANLLKQFKSTPRLCNQSRTKVA